MQYNDLSDLLFNIQTILGYEYDPELDNVASDIAELIYYIDTKK